MEEIVPLQNSPIPLCLFVFLGASYSRHSLLTRCRFTCKAPSKPPLHPSAARSAVTGQPISKSLYSQSLPPQKKKKSCYLNETHSSSQQRRHPAEISSSTERSQSVKMQQFLLYKTIFLQVSLSKTAKSSTVDEPHCCCRQKFTNTHAPIATTNPRWWQTYGRTTLFQKREEKLQEKVHSICLSKCKGYTRLKRQFFEPSKFNQTEMHLKMPASHH